MPQSDPTSLEAASRTREFVLWPEENGGKQTEADLRAVARKLSAGAGVVPGGGPSATPVADPPDEEQQAPIHYPATSAWRRTTSRAATTEQDRWWEAAPSLEDTTVEAPPRPRVSPPTTEPLLSPDEIWEMTARELEDASVLRTKAQPPASEDPTPPVESVSLEVEALDTPATPFVGVEPVVRQLSASLRASPFSIATRAETPLRTGVEAPAEVELDEDLVFPRLGEHPPSPHEDDELPDYGTTAARPLLTFWRLTFLLLLGAAVAGFLCRDHLSRVDWRGMWTKAIHSLGSITNAPSTPPVRKAVPLPTPAKPPASAAGRDSQLIESPTPPAAPDPPGLTAPAAATSQPGPEDSVPSPAPSPALDERIGPLDAGGDDPADVGSQPPEAEGVGTEGTSSTLWSGDRPAATPEQDLRTQEGGLKSRLSTSDQSEAAVAQAAVQNLITADSIDKVLPWIFEPDKLGAMVRDYHAMQPLNPLTGAVVEMEYSGVIPSSGAKAFIFNVLHPNHPRGFPVSAEHTSEGYRIDWQSYIQWRDEWLRRFVEKKTTEPQMLFVVLRRAHYFNDDVPRLDEKLCFKISSAVPGDEGTVAFVDHPSALGRSLATTYEWRKLYFPVVELQWVREPNSAPYVRLNRIVRPTWRRVGD